MTPRSEEAPEALHRRRLRLRSAEDGQRALQIEVAQSQRVQPPRLELRADAEKRDAGDTKARGHRVLQRLRVAELLDLGECELRAVERRLESRPGGGSGPKAGIRRQDGELVVDMDDLPRADQPPTVDIDDLRSRPGVPVESEGTWIFVEERGEWVRMPSSRRSPPGPTSSTSSSSHQ